MKYFLRDFYVLKQSIYHVDTTFWCFGIVKFKIVFITSSMKSLSIVRWLVQGSTRLYWYSEMIYQTYNCHKGQRRVTFQHTLKWSTISTHLILTFKVCCSSQAINESVTSQHFKNIIHLIWSMKTKFQCLEMCFNWHP